MDVPDRVQRRGCDPAGIGAKSILAAALTVVGVALAPGAALANGAFPDSQSVLTPSSRPNELSLLTNFGVVMSHDGGHTWLWSCEQTDNNLGYLYQYNAAPQNRLFAVANEKLVFSDDATCGWTAAQGMATGVGITDFFPDPSDPNRVLALAYDYTATTYVVLQSTDAGNTFTSKLYTSDPKATMTGIEIAHSDPRTIYVTLTAATTNAPMLGHSNDGGTTWQFTDLTSALGPGTPSIISVDPASAQNVLLLFKGTQQALGVTRDGGQTVTQSMTTAGSFTSSTRTSSGAILVAGVDVSTNPVLYRSTDSGVTFTTVATPPPHVRGLSTRGTQIYAAADEFTDGYALGVSNDDGATWQPVMSYDHVAAIIGCLKDACQTTCATEASIGLWDMSVCAANPPPMSDGGAPSGGDAAAGVGGSGGAAGAGGGGEQGHSSSSCSIAPGGTGGGADAGWLVSGAGLGVLLWLKRRRKRRS